MQDRSVVFSKPSSSLCLCGSAQFQMEVESHIQQNADKDICSQIYRDFEYFESGLSSAFEAFKQDTAEPVWNLR